MPSKSLVGGRKNGEQNLVSSEDVYAIRWAAGKAARLPLNGCLRSHAVKKFKMAVVIRGYLESAVFARGFVSINLLFSLPRGRPWGFACSRDEPPKTSA